MQDSHIAQKDKMIPFLAFRPVTTGLAYCCHSETPHVLYASGQGETDHFSSPVSRPARFFIADVADW